MTREMSGTRGQESGKIEQRCGLVDGRVHPQQNFSPNAETEFLSLKISVLNGELVPEIVVA